MFAVSRREYYVTPGLAVRLLTHAKRQEPARTIDLPELTERETQILAQVARGFFTNKEIARTLALSKKTVKHHMTNVMQKLRVRNRVDAPASHSA